MVSTVVSLEMHETIFYHHMPMISQAQRVDILHPLTSLEWKECQQLPVEMSSATAVWHRGKLYVGGWTSGSYKNSARLYVYTPTTDTWDKNMIDTPTYLFALTTYHYHLLLVGGIEYVSEHSNGNITNKLWTWSELHRWQETLPPVGLKRHNVCVVNYRDHLLVAGGMALEGTLKHIEVYNGSHWSFAQPLPMGYYVLKSAILDQHWYLMGGKRSSQGYSIKDSMVHFSSLDSILASCQLSETSQLPSIWKRLIDAPYQSSSAAVFGSRLIAVGGGEGVARPSSTVHAYSFQTNSWTHVGDMPFKASRTCSVVLPTGELMVVGGTDGVHFMTNVLKVTITGNLWLTLLLILLH